LLLCLDALGDDIEREGAGQCEHRGDDGPIIGVGSDTVYEGAVDLECVDWERLKVGEAGVSRAEVVDVERDAEVVDGVEGQQRTRVLHQYRFGDLQDE